MKEPNRRPLVLMAAIALALGLLACETDDTGTLCTTDTPTAIGDAPVGGEQAWVEVVRVQRDGECESFKCLRHAGLAPYCTRRCEYLDEDQSGNSCLADDECPGDENCADDGICRLDDCPAGFKCAKVQTVGPLAEDTYCVRLMACDANLDCRSLGSIDCVEHACYDKCNALAQDQECDFRERICEPTEQFRTHIECNCASAPEGGDDFANCSDANVQCKAKDSPNEVWPLGSDFERLGICLAKELVQSSADEGAGGGGGS